MRYLILPVAAVASIAASGPQGSLDIDISGVRNARGMLHACLTRDPRHFPDCKADPAAIRQSVQAASHHLHFDHVPAGRYALAIFHDENSNQRLDTLAHIPKEGFGFSRNPSMKFRAPRFDEVAVDLNGQPSRASIKMRYLL